MWFPKADEPRRPKPVITDNPPRWRGPVLGVLVVVGIGLIIRTSLAPDAPQPAPVASGLASAGPIPSEASSSAQQDPDRNPALRAGGRPGFHDRRSALGSENTDAGDDEANRYAVRGRGRPNIWSGGSRCGALRDAEGGTIAAVVTLGHDGQDGKIIRLARARGDVDPPVVAGAGDAVIAAMSEPNASGHSLKVAKIVGENVTWGPELAEGRDESPAYDLAIGATRAALVWDDPSPDSKRSNVVLSTFDPGTLRSATAARPISPPKTDADSPRIIARAGGFWLAYIAHADEDAPKLRKDKAPGDDDKPSKKSKDDDVENDIDLGETIAAAWIEMIPLDENGAPASTPRRATPKDGHVLAFDLEAGDDGSAILAWRDDDTPAADRAAGGEHRDSAARRDRRASPGRRRRRRNRRSRSFCRDGWRSRRSPARSGSRPRMEPGSWSEPSRSSRPSAWASCSPRAKTECSSRPRLAKQCVYRLCAAKRWTPAPSKRLPYLQNALWY